MTPHIFRRPHLVTGLLLVSCLVRPDIAEAALIDPNFGPVIVHEGVATIDPQIAGTAAIRHNDTALAWVEAGLYGHYTVVNNTTDLDILGFAVSNPESELAFVLSGSSWTGWNLDATTWNQPRMYSAVLAFAYAQATGTGFGSTAWTPGVVFGSYASNFGDDPKANLFYTTDVTGIVGPGEALNGFYFGPDQLASSFVAFAIPSGSFPSGGLTADDVQLVRGAAIAAVPLPATAWLLMTGAGFLGGRRLLRGRR